MILLFLLYFMIWVVLFVLLSVLVVVRVNCWSVLVFLSRSLVWFFCIVLFVVFCWLLLVLCCCLRCRFCWCRLSVCGRLWCVCRSEWKDGCGWFFWFCWVRFCLMYCWRIFRNVICCCVLSWICIMVCVIWLVRVLIWWFVLGLSRMFGWWCGCCLFCRKLFVLVLFIWCDMVSCNVWLSWLSVSVCWICIIVVMRSGFIIVIIGWSGYGLLVFLLVIIIVCWRRLCWLVLVLFGCCYIWFMMNWVMVVWFGCCVIIRCVVCWCFLFICFRVVCCGVFRYLLIICLIGLSVVGDNWLVWRVEYFVVMWFYCILGCFYVVWSLLWVCCCIRNVMECGRILYWIVCVWVDVIYWMFG